MITTSVQKIQTEIKSKFVKEEFDFPIEFWLVTLIAFINSLGFTIIIPLLYPYAKYFGLSDFQASLLSTAYAISQFFATPVLGRISDRLGRKPLLILSLIGTIVANIVAAFSPIVSLLYLARIIDGLTGGNNSIARAIVSDITTKKQRAQAFGIFDAIFRLGFVAGPIISYLAGKIPTFMGISSLGMSFLVAAIVASIATLLILVFLPETAPRVTTENFRFKWSDFGFIKILQFAPRPKFTDIFILTFLNGVIFTTFTFAFRIFTLNILEQTSKTLAIVFAVIGMLGLGSQIFILDPLRQKFNLVDILFLALIIRGIMLLLIPTFPTLTPFLMFTVIFGVVNSFPIPLIDSILSLNSSENEQGEILGLNTSYVSLSNAIGPAISGLLVTFSDLIPFWVTGGLSVLIAFFALKQIKLEFKCGQHSLL
ncbi:MFS transporter [Mastigocoleus testarum]|uniref:Multidrug transporter n=1 Tax=Mastigocoleus testarum BC008 TaxID=371196 RepID=A0A0V7ZM42_9CYAN|nr:MFS transporter [Mastigocoleus testarum]KST65285.1 multidrug transporter [Mastigocoleus testarum BC008]KST65661.1 multidrug transporter [Mastigocoleus testarum BC008]